MTPRSGRSAPNPDEEGPIGPFRTWNGVYAAVALATLAMILVLYWFTVALDHTAS